MSTDLSTTIGRERQLNAALALATVEQFVETQTAVHTPRPPNMERIVELNRGPFVEVPPPLRPVAAPDGATVLDVRSPDEYARGHVRGAINVPVSGSSFGTKTAFLVEPGERIVLHAASPGEAERAARRLHAVGFLELGGYLEHTDATATLEPVDLDELDRLLESGQAELLDVREGEEWQDGYIPGSTHVPYRLLRAVADTLPHDRTIVTICESGARAGVAASVLDAAGFRVRPVLHGGIDEWEKRGGQLVKFRRCGG
jgi:rhodanese-related sulfurtransferase